MVKQSLKKQPRPKRGAVQNPRLHWKQAAFPPCHFDNNGKSLGNPVVELATPKGTNNLTEGTNKNELRV